MILRLLVVLTVVVLSAGGAMAACGGDVVLSCTAKNGAKTLDVCLDRAAGEIRYSYGARNQQPELYLSRSIQQIENTPWAGVGRSIWESTVFYNQGYAYEVYISADRMAENNAFDGGVVLHKDGQEIARVECDAGTAEIGIWAVSDAKEALGICWDLNAHRWAGCS